MKSPHTLALLPIAMVAALGLTTLEGCGRNSAKDSSAEEKDQSAVQGDELGLTAPSFLPGGSGAWVQSFNDDFNAFDSSKWYPSSWWGDTGIGDGTLSYYTKANLSVANGNLVMKLNNNKAGGRNYTGAIADTKGKFFQKYGYFEARVKVPHASGIATAFLLAPNTGKWPPELDIFEIPGLLGRGGKTTHSTVHWSDRVTGAHKSKSVWFHSPTVLTGGYRTYGVLWQPTYAAFFVDGKEFNRITEGIPQEDMHVRFLLGCGNDNTWYGPLKMTFPQ